MAGGQRRRDGGIGRLALGLVLAVGLHAVLLPLLPAVLDSSNGKQRHTGTQYVRLSKEQFDKNRRIEMHVDEAKKASDEEKKKKEQDDEADTPGQVVSL
ncbi:MAG TPA: hypothetical protein VGO62_14985, partial [Myxococcota bacterium]